MAFLGPSPDLKTTGGFSKSINLLDGVADLTCKVGVAKAGEADWSYRGRSVYDSRRC